MELGIWGTLWANCALGPFFALPSVPIITTENEEFIQKADEDSSRQDHETQTCSFSDSEEESEYPENAADREVDDENSNITDGVSELQNNCFNSDSNSLNSVIDNIEETDKVKAKGKKIKSFQRNRYSREEYKCTICPYTCTTERAFLRHLRSHTEEDEKNGIQGSSNQNHESIPRLSCPVCGKDRSGEAALNKHMLRHRDKNRNFCCDICAFKTVQLKKLIQHRRMHTGERPHLCPHCVYRAARRDNLRSHVRRVHKKDNLTCDTFNPRGMLLIPSKSSASTTSSSSPSTIEKSEEQE